MVLLFNIGTQKASVTIKIMVSLSLFKLLSDTTSLKTNFKSDLLFLCRVFNVQFTNSSDIGYPYSMYALKEGWI